MKNIFIILIFPIVAGNTSAQSWTPHTNQSDLYFEGGNVGIGTSSPGATLHVNGLSQFDDRIWLKTENSGGIGFGNNWLAYSVESSDALVFTHSGSGGAEFEIRNVDNNVNNSLAFFRGKLGVGIKPNELLHLYQATNNSVLKIETDKVDGTARLFLVNDVQSWDVRTSASDDFYIVDGNTVEVPFKIQPGAPTNTLFLKSSGNVGIGSNLATNKLWVEETTTNKSAATFVLNSTNTPNTGAEGIKIYNKESTDNSISAIKFDHNDPGGSSRHTSQIISGKEPGWIAGNSSTYKGYLSFWTRPGGNQVERLRITSDGYVGIGTSLPDGILHLKSNANTNFELESSATNGVHWRFASLGDVSGRAGNFELQDKNNNRRPFAIAPQTGTSSPGYALFIDSQGKIGINTTVPDQILTVGGKIHTEEVIVDLNVPGPDYVFEPDYKLPPLKSVEKFIRSEKHLPEVPSSKEMEENGIQLAEMNLLLLKKIEELTLYQIELLKRIEKLEKKAD